jgi:zinc/manganese transport system permease protein
MLGGAVLLGMGGSIAGLLLSYHTGLASGPAIVLALGAAFLVSALASPRYGLLAALRRARDERRAVRHTTE